MAVVPAVAWTSRKGCATAKDVRTGHAHAQPSACINNRGPLAKLAGRRFERAVRLSSRSIGIRQLM